MDRKALGAVVTPLSGTKSKVRIRPLSLLRRQLPQSGSLETGEAWAVRPADYDFLCTQYALGPIPPAYAFQEVFLCAEGIVRWDAVS